MKKKLLLADDSITIQKVVGIIFAPENYDLLIASDGDKAYEMAQSHQPDLVIADIGMPGRDGFELCREIKSNPGLAQTSVLLLPGAFEKFDETRAVEVCADGWLTKPFESQALLDKVTALSEMPPLRLVPAEEPVVGVDSAAEKAAEEVEIAAEEESYTDPQELGEQSEEELTEVDEVVEEDSDSGLWGEVSFEEDDLKPQDLLAAGDEDEEEDNVTDMPDVDEPSAELTPEQLAPYAATTAQSDTQKEIDTPDFEPPTEEEELEKFGAAQAEETQDLGEDADEVIELMAEDLDEEEELVEDSDTFIDLVETDEVIGAEETAEAPVFDENVQESAVQEEILDLTESDIVADAPYVVAGEEDDAEVLGEDLVTDEEGPADEEVFDESLVEGPETVDQFLTPDEDDVATVETEQMAAPEEGRRDDDLFVDEEGALYSEDDSLDDVEAAAEEIEPVAASVPDATPVAAQVEEQLKQLPEQELKQIIEKIAAPMIEALAREMLEQIVWEVVPDLAETMISAEIEKIKRGEH